MEKHGWGGFGRLSHEEDEEEGEEEESEEEEEIVSAQQGAKDDFMDDVSRRGLSRDVSLEGAQHASPLELLEAVPVSLRDGTPAGSHANDGRGVDAPNEHEPPGQTQRSVQLVR